MTQAQMTMGRVIPSTLYQVEAYGPVALDDLKQLYTGLALPWKQQRSKFRRVAVDKGGHLFVPIATVLDVVRANLAAIPGELEQLLYSQLLWADGFQNLVVNTGLDDLLDKRFKGSSYTAADYVGVTDDAPTFAAGDTMASHAGWAEVTAYSQGTRPSLTLGSVSSQSVDNSASKAAFSINGTTTIGGAFITTNSTKGGSTGILYGGGALTEGDRALISGDSLSVQVTLTAAAA